MIADSGMLEYIKLLQWLPHLGIWYFRFYCISYMDTHMRHRCRKRQMSFLGEVAEKRLKRVLFVGHGLVMDVVHIVLSEDLLKSEHRY